MFSLQADDNWTAIYCFYAQIHHLRSIQSATDDLGYSCILAKTYLLLMGFYGGPWVFM